jgi:adenosylhomocysteine nucleosidase
MGNSNAMTGLYDSPILICFAVKEEARFFLLPGLKRNRKGLITGMGRHNAATSFRRALSDVRPRLVITAGFAGGLNPDLKVGTVVFDQDYDAGLGGNLLSWGAVQGAFHCARRVAVTAVEKKELWKSTGCDAVEMESAVIRTICHEEKIPSATIRVISDAANEDLPLDFNALMTPADRINYFKLAWKVLSGPQKIPQLMRFNEQTIMAARKLGEALEFSLREGCS